MSSEGRVYVPVRADCGHEFEVDLVGRDPHTMEFTCPVCGAAERFTPEQADTILAQYEAAKKDAADAVKDFVRKLNKRR
ncbi:hypothetical protein [Sphingomonas sp. 3-13AW]|uniref:hypothetical protein n=1 Tax=Sphingomonas sp. 3-13AW TaxID=3050450 RepID=UPI003BB5163C